MRKSFIKLFSLLLIIIFTLMICGCSNENNDPTGDPNTDTPDDPIEEYVETNICPYCKKCIDETCTHCEEKCSCEPVEVDVDTWDLLAGTDYQTPVYQYSTNKEGPRICIVGGIHGDELAGWSAALRMVESLETERGIRGTILLIPKANILADNARKRYSVSGYSFSDLNRSFPLERYTSATTETIKISTAILQEVEKFNPDYIIDLHESRHSWTEMEDGTYTSLGDTLISSNQGKFMRSLVNYYNSTYKKDGETKFRIEETNQKGSFNYYFTFTYPDKVVFTVETNRNSDTALLQNRVRQQLNMIQALFDLAWDRV